MPTTTNYGWTTPADTDLVKDGASAIRTLGTAIDTTVFNNASAAIAKTIVDAKGDIIAATAADTVARLAVGSNDQVLTADSSTATGLKWAAPASGGMTLLSTTTLSGTSTTISSISQSYQDLYIIAQGVTMNVSNESIDLNPNNASLNTYTYIENATLSNSNATSIFLSANTSILRTGGQNAWATTIYNYASTVYYKTFNWNGVYVNGSSLNKNTFGGGGIRTTSAITSLVFNCGGGNSFSGGQVLIYGVK